jgi:hypothetical protein
VSDETYLLGISLVAKKTMVKKAIPTRKRLFCRRGLIRTEMTVKVMLDIHTLTADEALDVTQRVSY